MKELLMGNEAIALGALVAGVKVVSGYPGTPSTEVLETIAKRRTDDVYVEWSVNEKTAMEVAAGAAVAGARALVTMKQVGLNVASDPLMCINYVGVKGALVVLVCDDPGPISSQTEQDTRAFGRYAHIPVLDPATPEEAYQMIQDAFDLSESIGTPVILRPTTRVCHACASIDIQPPASREGKGFTKDSRWCIFPRLSYNAKKKLFARESELAKSLSDYPYNRIEGVGTVGIVTGGVSAAYAKDAIRDLGADVRVLTVATPYPFPEPLAEQFLAGLKRVLVIEELDPVLEDALLHLAGKKHLAVEICGKYTGHTITAGENSHTRLRSQIASFLGIEPPATPALDESAPALPVRPPTLCAGCPHRASFYAVKRAMEGRPAVFGGDIGCYTLGNAAPLNMVDTCLCMGAAITMPQGIARTGHDAVHFGFVGDSTFFHSGITNVINAVYNNMDEVVVILDNSTTAMTGHQPHPGIGRTMMGDVSAKVSIERLLEAIGVTSVRIVNPLDLRAATKAVREASYEKGVRAIIFRAPCVALFKGETPRQTNYNCIGCQTCIREIGCPALSMLGDRCTIDTSLCNGCGLCEQVCVAQAIEEVK